MTNYRQLIKELDHQCRYPSLVTCPFCSALCGSKAQGSLKITHKTSLPICQQCRQKIDPTNIFEFIPFDA
jgi:transcription elongation factor Elf1